MQLKPLALIQAFYAQELSPRQKAKARESLRRQLALVEAPRDGVFAYSNRGPRRSSATGANG